MRVYFRRGIFFTKSFLTNGGTVFSADEWHSKVGTYPRTLARVLRRKSLFVSIGERAQDSLVGSILDVSEERSIVLHHLEELMNAGALSERQKSRLLVHIDEMPVPQIRSSKLSTKVCYKRLLAELKSHNWYKQQPAVDVVAGNGPEKLRKLSTADQVTLGRNILQVADGGERSAKR
jgi:hypothetical protein